MIPPDTVSIDFLARQQGLLLDELRAVRSENREMRRVFTLISEHFSRQERRIAELRDDFETMLKLEVGGAVVNLETRLEIYIDQRFAKLEQSQGNLEQGQAELEQRLARLEQGQAKLEQGQAGLSGKLDAILGALRNA